MSRSERTKELERRDLEMTAESQALADAAKSLVLESAGKLIDQARADPAFEVPEENTAIRRLAEITGRSGTHPRVEPAILETVADPFPSPSEPPVVTAIVGESTGPITLRPVQIDAAARTERVLVVEDDKSIADLIAEILRDEGYAVRTAEHGIEALSKILIDKPPPDVVILDLGLPYLSGEGVVAALLTTHLANLPILRISASVPDAIPEHARNDFVFVKKPIHLPELLRVVRERIAEWRARVRG